MHIFLTRADNKQKTMVNMDHVLYSESITLGSDGLTLTYLMTKGQKGYELLMAVTEDLEEVNRIIEKKLMHREIKFNNATRR